MLFDIGMLYAFGGNVMEGYMTTKEAAERWNISQRQVQIHCKKGRIPGVTTVGTNYLIPINASRPIYGFFSYQENEKEDEINCDSENQ